METKIKEFLKPDWKKLTISVISISVFLGFMLIYTIRVGHLTSSLSLFDFILILIYVISFYLISCFIVFCYNRIKAKIKIETKSIFVKFLLPDWRKIVTLISLILILMLINLSMSEFLLSAGGPFTPALVPLLSLPPYCEISCMGPIFQPELASTHYEFTYDCHFGLGCSGTPTLLSWSYNLVYWYLLSCIIILGYDKFKNRKIDNKKK